MAWPHGSYLVRKGDADLFLAVGWVGLVFAVVPRRDEGFHTRRTPFLAHEGEPCAGLGGVVLAVEPFVSKGFVSARNELLGGVLLSLDDRHFLVAFAIRGFSGAFVRIAGSLLVRAEGPTFVQEARGRASRQHFDNFRGQLLVPHDFVNLSLRILA